MRVDNDGPPGIHHRWVPTAANTLSLLENEGFMLNGQSAFLKIVVFDQADYEWAKQIHKQYFFAPMFLSAGNDAGKTVGNPSRVDNRNTQQVTQDLLNRARWLTNRVMVDPNMRDVRVQAQYHVLLWGNELGH